MAVAVERGGWRPRPAAPLPPPGLPPPPPTARPPARPPTPAAARAAGRATRSPAGADPDDAPSAEPAPWAALQGPERRLADPAGKGEEAGAAAGCGGPPGEDPAHGAPRLSGRLGGRLRGHRVGLDLDAHRVRAPPQLPAPLPSGVAQAEPQMRPLRPPSPRSRAPPSDDPVGSLTLSLSPGLRASSHLRTGRDTASLARWRRGGARGLRAPSSGQGRPPALPWPRSALAGPLATSPFLRLSASVRSSLLF